MSTETIVDGIIKDVDGAIISVTETIMIADQPWLATPGVKQIFEGLLNWFGGYFTKAAQTGATFLIIDQQEKDSETNISVALQNLIAAERTGNQDAIQTAIQNYAKAQSGLVSILH